MKQLLALIACTSCALLSGRAAVELEPGDQLNINSTRFVLTNGLTLVVHEDHKSPIVAVNVWYHVGSKNEPDGRTGFAHLFEHLMFNGSENFNDDYFKAMEKVGATGLNGTTSEDRTNYFENAPKDALDYLLWMESDRMGHLLGAIDQAKLDEQRGVVQNEKRQSENQPYGLVEELIARGTYPAEHPYSRTVIGSIEDLNAATLGDVKEWFRKYYGAANATLVVAGDIETAVVREKVERYFGAIPAGPPLTKAQNWVAKRTGTHRQLTQDRVPQARIHMVWNVPAFGDAQFDYLDLVSDVLARGKTSRLYQRIVFEEQIATDISAFVNPREIGSQFYIVATARPGRPLEAIEAAIREELRRFLDQGPTAQELHRVKTQFLATFIRGAERIGGFGGKSDILATYQVYTGDPANYRRTLERVQSANASDLTEAARQWLSDGVFELEVQPYPTFGTLPTEVDRSKLPVPKIVPNVNLPEQNRTRLANGLNVIVAERPGNPQVVVRLQSDAGYAADQFAVPGTAKLAMNMLDEGTETRTSLEISDELALLGAVLNAGSDLDTSTVVLSALKANLDASLELFADVVLHPAFRETDFKRLQNQQLDAIQREKSEPSSMALRVVPRLLYGPDHAYSIPFTGSGTTESVMKIAPQTVREFHTTWFRPNNATLIVVGATTLAEMQPKLEKLFGAWQPGNVPKKNILDVQPPEKPLVYLMNRPAAVQSVIFAGNLAPPKSDPHEIAIEVMNTILGGAFTSRLNMNLREDKHWSYGASSSVVPARGPRPFLVIAPVQTDKTSEAMREIDRELRGILGQQPVTPDELAKAQAAETLTLPGQWETIGAVSSAIAEIVRFRLPEDYFELLPKRVLALTIPDVARAAELTIQAPKLLWVVVGDESKIEPELRKLNLGEIRRIDADGNPLR